MDVIITHTIPDAKVVEFSAGFLAKCPIPQIPDPEWIPGFVGEPQPMINEYTPKEWITEWMRRDVIRAYRHGKKLLAEQAAIIDEDII